MSITIKLEIMATDQYKQKNKSKTVVTLRKGLQVGESILNGIVGDYLSGSSNGLSIDMQFFRHGQPLVLDKGFPEKYDAPLSPKICILVHGLLNNETTWNYRESDEINYGSLLQNDLNYTPFYVRYNTGIHISENGKLLSQLIASLIAVYPVRVKEIVMIAHSMGGLVVRSACHYAPLQGADWYLQVSKLIFMGTPHLGAPLEKFGNAVTYLLKKLPVSYTKLTGDIINLRSAGIKDLRYGYLTDEDWEGHHPDQLLKNNKTIVPLLEHVEYFLVTGTLTKDPQSLASQWFGDVMVLKSSATGHSRNKHHLDFNLKNHKEFAGVAHQKLVNHPEVYDQIRSWMSKKSKTTGFSPSDTTLNINKRKSSHFPKVSDNKKSKLSGIKTLSADAFKHSISKLEELNESRITYKILNHIPLVNIFSKEIENTQVQLTSQMLRSLKKLVT